jgi:hypothetical protein
VLPFWKHLNMNPLFCVNKKIVEGDDLHTVSFSEKGFNLRLDSAVSNTSCDTQLLAPTFVLAINHMGGFFLKKKIPV